MTARVLPSLAALTKMVEQGMTHAQIAAKVSKDTGVPVARSTVSAALSRGGETEPLKRHASTIPWTVRVQHQTHYAARMLRLLGRRMGEGKPLSKADDGRLDAWLSQLDRSGAVVVYVPDTEDGFFYVEGTPDRPGIPVRKNF